MEHKDALKIFLYTTLDNIPGGGKTDPIPQTVFLIFSAIKYVYATYSARVRL